eukprot:960885-Alexandrium_andersonii.AAC.1
MAMALWPYCLCCGLAGRVLAWACGDGMSSGLRLIGPPSPGVPPGLLLVSRPHALRRVLFHEGLVAGGRSAPLDPKG